MILPGRRLCCISFVFAYREAFLCGSVSLFVRWPGKGTFLRARLAPCHLHVPMS